MEVNVKVRIAQEVNVLIEPEELIYNLNFTSIQQRWNLLSKVMDTLDLKNGDLTEDQKNLVKAWLKLKLKSLKY